MVTIPVSVHIYWPPHAQDLLEKYKEEAEALAPKKAKAKAQPKAEQQAKVSKFILFYLF